MSVNCNMKNNVVHLQKVEGNCTLFWYNFSMVCLSARMPVCSVNNTFKSSPVEGVNVLALEKLVPNRYGTLAWESSDWQ